MASLNSLTQRMQANTRLATALGKARPDSEAFDFDDLATASRHGISGPWLSRSAQGQTVLHSIQARWVRMLNLSTRISETLNAAGIPLVILKGVTAAAAWQVPWLRAQSDIDVLVGDGDVLNAAKVLAGAGLCAPIESQTAMHARLPLLDFPQAYVEVHRTLSVDFQTLPAVNLLANFEVVTVDGQELAALAIVPRMTHLLLHAATHACCRYVWLLDIVELARVMTDDDWQEVVRTAEHWRAEIPVWWALNRTQHVFKTVMPTDVLSALEPSKQRRTVLEWLAPRAEADHPDGLTQKLFRLALLQREQLPGALERGLRRLVTPG